MLRSKTGNTRAGNASAGRLKIQDRPVRGSRGFTLVEMVVVISMILILLSIALPMYNQSIIRAKEAKLHQNLTTINKVIQEYSLDKKKAPQALEDLVPGYLKFIPEDITGRNDTWVTEAEDSENAWDPSQTGIAGVHSGSNEVSSDGSAYSTWTH
jgi:general secretion pathway protein G